VTFATVELKAIAEQVLCELASDPVSAGIVAETADPIHDRSFNSRLAHITQIKDRLVFDYLQVCLIRLQTQEDSHISPVTQIRAQDQLTILKALLAV
jgi:hypothetical protein